MEREGRRGEYYGVGMGEGREMEGEGEGVIWNGSWGRKKGGSWGRGRDVKGGGRNRWSIME